MTFYLRSRQSTFITKIRPYLVKTSYSAVKRIYKKNTLVHSMSFKYSCLYYVVCAFGDIGIFLVPGAYRPTPRVLIKRNTNHQRRESTHIKGHKLARYWLCILFTVMFLFDILFCIFQPKSQIWINSLVFNY